MNLRDGRCGPPFRIRAEGGYASINWAVVLLIAGRKEIAKAAFRYEKVR